MDSSTKLSIKPDTSSAKITGIPGKENVGHSLLRMAGKEGGGGGLLADFPAFKIKFSRYT